MKKVRMLVLALAFGAIFSISGTMQGGYVSADNQLNILASSSSPHLKIQAMNALSMRGDPRARDAIYQNVNSRYLNVRLNALRSLGRYHSPADLGFLESVILDFEGRYTVQERIVAVKGYVNIEGWDQEVLEEAQLIADNPLELEILDRALHGESLNVIGRLLQ